MRLSIVSLGGYSVFGVFVVVAWRYLVGCQPMESQSLPVQNLPVAEEDEDVLEPMPGPYVRAWDDILRGLRGWHLWFYLGWNDILSRYRRSVLGPVWLTMNMATMTGLTGVLYGSLFHMDLKTYLPYLCAGMLMWTTFSNIISESCVTFVDAGKYLTQMQMNMSSFIYQMLWRNTIVFLHMLVVYVFVALVFQQHVGFGVVLVVPGLALWLINGFWVGLLLSTLAARFRDLSQIVGSLLQVAFFLTPILWKPDLLGNRIYLANVNPLYHFIELVRGPLLGVAPPVWSWLVCLGVTVLTGACALWVFARGRPRIPFWM